MAGAVRGFLARTAEAVRWARGTHAVDYAAVEASLAAEAGKVERQGHAEVLAALEVDAPTLTCNGERHTRIGHAPGT